MNREKLSLGNNSSKKRSMFGLLITSALIVNMYNNSNDNNNDIEIGIGKNTYNPTIPDLYTILDMEIQPDDEGEFALYEKTLDEYYMADNYMKVHGLQKYRVPIMEILPLYIKESRLDGKARSRSGADGRAQMSKIALEQVKIIIGKKTFSHIPPKYKNTVCSMIYYIYTKERIQKETKMTDSKEIIEGSYAAYNMGIGDFLALYENFGSPDNRNDIAKELVSIVGITSDPKTITDKDYNVDGYLDWFGDTKIPDTEHVINDKRKIRMGKIKETVRYVELTSAIMRNLQTNKGKVFSIVEKEEGRSLFESTRDEINKLQEVGTIKEGEIGNLVKHILLDNGVTAHSPYLEKDTIEIDQSLLTEYLIDEDIKKFTYQRIDYARNYYYRSILNELLNTERHINTLNIKKTNIYKNTPHDDHTHGDGDHEEIPFQVKQIIDEAILYFNYAKRINPNLAKNEYMLLPSTEFIDRYEENRGEFTNIVEKLVNQEIVNIGGTPINNSEINIGNTGQMYADKTFDAFAENIMEAPKRPITVNRFYNPKIKRALNKNGTFNPTHIMLHHTAAIIDESKDGHGTINAHFYIDRNGNIYESSAEKGKEKNTQIGKGKIAKLNHAGVGTRGSYGAIRKGDDQITYKAIGIEIETGTDRNNEEINNKQYAALEGLLGTLSSQYNIPEKNILTHSMVAVHGRTNNKTKQTTLYRGRKPDPRGFEYKKAGMKTNPFQQIDPEVTNGKVNANISAMYRDRGGSDLKRRKKTIDAMTIGLRTAEKIAKSR